MYAQNKTLKTCLKGTTQTSRQTKSHWPTKKAKILLKRLKALRNLTLPSQARKERSHRFLLKLVTCPPKIRLDNSAKHHSTSHLMQQVPWSKTVADKASLQRTSQPLKHLKVSLRTQTNHLKLRGRRSPPKKASSVSLSYLTIQTT